MKVTVVQGIMDANKRVARANQALFARHRLLVLNLMSSPGAGKTALLERTIRDLRGELRIGVIEGDIQTSLDAERIERAGAAYAHQINTQGACHIDGNMIAPVIEEMDLGALDLLVVENVGNLVCPAEFDLGEDRKVVLFSVTEGEDKPKKYPLMFQESDLMLVHKIDLLPHLDTDLALIHRHALEVHPDLTILDLSCKSGQGLEAFYTWLRAEIARKRAAPA
ncbi:MAG TPA: hydrogenase nickel incorporation protein HypB [Myxococcota bacterium]|nr:hydrogenase nickel incorporation protein HypB [Myxococcota bacterium]HRY95230.1 hydrogenase nickel incorporation protein HypB [Myxococcota bacterium]HSA20752.1 hydrogenase nickel incorporation protein HypB [Myxococcota bacterium]